MARHYVERVSASKAPSPPIAAGERADRAVRHLEEMAADLRGCALLGPAGEVLAASGDSERRDWAEAAAGLLSASDAARGEPAEQVHVGTEDGEVFVVRHRGLAMVAVAERFTLGSLLVCDIRVVLRELAAGAA